MWIIITGNVIDGLGLIGPFPDMEQAHEYAENLPAYAGGDHYTITSLEAPTKETEEA